MNKRYSRTERIGVNAVERIVIQELGWIFRDQPIVDVGVDAIIEQCENGNPTGKFIAIQIKCGAGNFHISEKKITYYDVSHIHYHYWLGLNIPIILVAHLPDSEETYWQHICKDNFKKTDTRWKLEIPKKQRFGKESKGKLTRILSEKGKRNFIFDLYSGNIDVENDGFDFFEKVNCIAESSICFENIRKIFNDAGERINKFHREISTSSHDYKIYINGLSRDFNIYSKRLEFEIDIFSKLYPEGFFAYEQFILFNYLVNNDTDLVRNAVYELNETSNATDELIKVISSLEHAISGFHEEFKPIVNCFFDILGFILLELSEARDMTSALLHRINEYAPHHQPPPIS
ncbi:MAG: protein of unknown function (DUF4365) [Candidatus Electronema aureum]|uniref:DUF4365 domain-containing protein n=1 Tax=Candidatus Electronema aureum TaxID=2005002 RepID=A0A521G2Q2_9BACT|nr:MAG: protein of unknown function (DUF4365) [Candidatus Electronema aureum]